jgi:4-carboxymuconolactone decarboxylase
MNTSPRIPPVIPGTRPALAAVEQGIINQRGAISPLYQVLLNSAPLAQGWEKLLTALRNQSSVPAGLRELTILRVAVLNHAPFEFDAHVPHALKAGIGQATIDALKAPGIDAVFSPVERAVLTLTDEMTRNVQVHDDVFDAVRPHFDAQALTELVATIAAYNMVSRFLEAMRIGH